ncbi:hypothetical protein HY091_02065 [Candidatus Kaiserbacteria bacterium]|nr:hypothetical protein [Candidatus Kaiserbacteria bacterium]
MKESLQAIEDYYYKKGLRGAALRKASSGDIEYMKILKKRQTQLTKNFRIKPSDRKKYVLSTNEDYEILNKIYRLEKKKLFNNDKTLLKLLRMQLENDWRTPIMRVLNELLRKYR